MYTVRSLAMHNGVLFVSLSLWRTGLTDATLPLVTRLVKQHNIR